MDIDAGIAFAGLLVGGLVGLTGMGGGALMTPLLVLVFGVNPLAAVSSDLVAAVVMKPVGGGVHLRRGTVHRGIVFWLVVGSVPAAFGGVLLLDALGDSVDLEDVLGRLIGVVLLVAATAMFLKMRMRERTDVASDVRDVAVRPLPTVAIGVFGGLIVGLSSVGSGSLMLVLLLAVYPRLSASQLVGTDLVQAVPLVGAAALGHVFFGDVQVGVTTSLLIGAVPGVYVGARASAGGAEKVIRPALIVVLVSSGLKLVGAPTGAVVAGAVVVGAALLRIALTATSRAAADPQSALTIPSAAIEK